MCVCQAVVVIKKVESKPDEKHAGDEPDYASCQGYDEVFGEDVAHKAAARAAEGAPHPYLAHAFPQAALCHAA